MNYRTPPKFHFATKKGWINDPNGLVYFNGYYHIFYQHSPNFEKPWNESMHWGHARTKDFLIFEEIFFSRKKEKSHNAVAIETILSSAALFLFFISSKTCP